MQQLDLDLIRQRIAVESPYFAFNDIFVDTDNTVHGHFIPEQAMGHEYGFVSAAELGRHLAILGSCAAAALVHSERFYYLAMKANYITLRPIQYKQETLQKPLHASAKILSCDTRTLVAATSVAESATDGGKFVELIVEYKVLSEKKFKRLFAHFNHESSLAITSATSPYKQAIPLFFDPPSDSQLTAHSAALMPSQCAGHFANYPAWPVAIIAYSLLQVAGQLFHHVINAQEKYIINKVDLTVNQLISAHDALSFQAEYLPTSTAPSRYAFACNVIHQGEVVVNLYVELDRLH